MDLLLDVIKALFMLGFVAGVIVVLAGLFMVVFGIATGIDRKMQE